MRKAPKECPTEICLAKVCPKEECSAEICLAKDCPKEECSAEVCPAQIRKCIKTLLRKQERALNKAIQGSTGKTRSAERTAVPEKVAQERQARHRQQVKLHKRIWKLYRQGCHKEQIAQLVGVSSRKVYRALEQETPPPPRRRARSSSIVDPYLSYLTSRWNQGCHNVAQLYKEIVAQGYTGTQRTLQLRLLPFRQKVARPVSKQTVIWDKPPSS